jgi:uncharacterized protein YjbI with pentapeptide repeats
MSTAIKKFFIRSVYGRDLFDDIIAYSGRDGWNRFFARLNRQGFWGSSIPMPDLGPDEYEFQPICVEFDLSGQDFKKADLGGLNFVLVDLARSDFSEANLSGAKIGHASGAVFRNADLRNATFTGCISGADFEGAIFDGTVFDGVYCDSLSLPNKLPEQYWIQCLLTPVRCKNPDNDNNSRVTGSMLKVKTEFYPHL